MTEHPLERDISELTPWWQYCPSCGKEIDDPDPMELAVFHDYTVGKWTVRYRCGNCNWVIEGLCYGTINDDQDQEKSPDETRWSMY